MPRKKFKIAPFLFLAAPLFFFGLFIIGPSCYSVYLSFTKWDFLSPIKFVGLRNFRILFSDPVFLRCLMNNVKWIIVFFTIPLFFGLLIALALDKVKKGSSIFKTGFYIPMTISMVAVSLMWAWIYHPQSGLLNNVLQELGLGFLSRAWLGDPSIVLYSIMVTAMWVHIPFVIIIFLVGLTNIQPEIIEAAKIDGASGSKLTRYIVIPLLEPSFIIAICITVVTSLRSFDIVYAMTEGGPANSSNVLSLLMYQEAFHNYRMGYGASIAVVLTLITFTFIVIYLNRVFRKEIKY